MNLSGRVALITGASNGLGRALSLSLYRRGCHLALVDIDLENLKTLKNLLDAGQQVVTIHPVDVSNKDDIAELREVIIKKHNRLDILINNAAISNSQPFNQLRLSDFRDVFEVNFWGTVYFTSFFLNDLRSQSESFLVNIISNFAMMGFPGKTSYGSSKGAIMSFTNSLRTELDGTSVKISLVIPPPLDTLLVKRGKHINDEKKVIEADFLRKKGMPIEMAAEKIVSGFLSGKFRIVVGWRMTFLDLLIRLFPGLIHKMIRKNKDKFGFI